MFEQSTEMSSNHLPHCSFLLSIVHHLPVVPLEMLGFFPVCD